MATEQFWEHAYGERDVHHPVVQVFAQQRVDWLRSHLPLGSIQSALDVGCGSGFSTFYMAKFVPCVIGLDRSPFMLHRHPFHPQRLVLGDAYCLPFAANSFDLVYAWELLHHVEDPLPMVREMARVSQKWVMLFEPSRYHPVQFALALVQKEHRPIIRFSARFLRNLLEASGLRPLRICRVGWIFPNKTPLFLLSLLRRLPFETPFGISYAVLGEKP